MDISNYRNEIDEIDQELIKDLDRRMRVSEKIAEWKKENDVKVYDPVRERELLDKIVDASSPDLAYYNKVLFRTIMEMSREHQMTILHQESALAADIRHALDVTPNVFPEQAVVACQGVPGAYSQEACDRFFKMPKIMYMKNFRGVFAAIQGGLCRYGILPIENSTAGSVNQVYDLMMEYNFHIVRSMKVKINHCLLANPGTRKEDIREIVSHEQALAQCEEYLKNFPLAKIHVVENTAEAAKMVSESGRKDIAAIASGANGQNYSLECLDENIQDSGNNYTRFICITKDLEIYPGANRTSIMLVTEHRPGALYQVMARFNALGVNILKLESRPRADTEFEFMFYFDIEQSVYSEEFVQMISQLEDCCQNVRYLGSYQEV
ncbi:MAG: prephenate dehydratase [Eubacteriales bacterium]|nr:prephenate dehydratase [Eubacteriales bacterium]